MPYTPAFYLLKDATQTSRAFQADQGVRNEYDVDAPVLEKTPVHAAGPRVGGGLKTFSDIDLNEAGVVVKASPGQLYGWSFFNTTAATIFVHFYDGDHIGVISGSSPAKMPIGVPAHSGRDFDSSVGIEFVNGIVAQATSGPLGTESASLAANALIANFFLY